ncbi:MULTISPECIES: hypothetical protein [Mycolicibacterium]|uniref:Cellulose synthase regulatory subunit n=2 Tax=Mycolicibacterium gilvum TaxID=1804 RepID=E6TA06_MYCSR|nr:MULTISPECIES: hypothetical protein [Mycolicibacterium]ABP42703.1 conserved hypothetical protein [Mycolicibacterium gilvum PYR-GCK]ADT97278.1 hypothetical protein Mspyr1_05690 [Mycolicibacterium gilvum Spyr1]MBV5245298.1 cellulose biosynthesis cyclic di-GMP-binding regulatory protein BcsB [Mycolicibacterium sp. PAM1]
MTETARSVLLRLMVCAFLASAAFSAGPSAIAQPPKSPDVVPGAAQPITLSQLGLSDKIDIVGSNQNADIAIPTPVGVQPVQLTGQIGSVVNVRNGRVDVIDSRGVVLGSMPVPTGLASVPFSIDLRTAKVGDGRTAITFVLRDDNADANSCSQSPSLTLSQMTTAFSGPVPSPTTIADFLPGYLDEILIRVGPEPSRSQQQAALALVAKLTHLYRPIPVRIDVTAAAQLPPAKPLRRIIDIREGGEGAIGLERPGTPNAVLTVTGVGDELERQVELFSDRRFGLAQTPFAATLSASHEAPQLTDIKTFAELGMTGEVSVLGTRTLYAGFDVSAFGLGPISRAKAHIKARYTPVVGGEASVVLRSGSTVLDSRRLDESGLLDTTVDIPAEVITSNVGMGFEIRYVPRQECAPLTDRISFSLDPESTISITPGTRNRGGFPVLPMAFTPDFAVVVDDWNRIGFAAQAINLLAQQASVVLRPRITDLSQAAASRPGLLAVVSGDTLSGAGMSPPLVPVGSDTAAINGVPTATDVDLNGPLGVVQAFTHNDRMVLAVSGSEDWSLVGRTFDHIRGLESRWASLSGDVVATGSAAETVSLTIREGGGLVSNYPGDGWKWWAWLSIGAGCVAVIVAVAVLVLRRRRLGH